MTGASTRCARACSALPLPRAIGGRRHCWPDRLAPVGGGSPTMRPATGSGACDDACTPGSPDLSTNSTRRTRARSRASRHAKRDAAYGLSVRLQTRRHHHAEEVHEFSLHNLGATKAEEGTRSRMGSATPGAARPRRRAFWPTMTGKAVELTVRERAYAAAPAAAWPAAARWWWAWTLRRSRHPPTASSRHLFCDTSVGAAFPQDHPGSRYHKATQGHHFQIAIEQELSRSPPSAWGADGGRRLRRGWGLYRDGLADEMGLSLRRGAAEDSDAQVVPRARASSSVCHATGRATTARWATFMHERSFRYQWCDTAIQWVTVPGRARR